MKWIVTLTALIVFIPQSFALIDMRNANYSEGWTDIILPGSGYDMRIRRTYNSRTLFNGVFGFGWCSDYETKLQITGEGTVLLTECGGGLDITYAPEGFKTEKIDQVIDKIMTEVKKRNPDLTQAALASLKKRLDEEKFLRDEFSRNLKLEGPIKAGAKYFASGRENEYIVKSKGAYTRFLGDGTFQKFDKEGYLIALFDRNGNSIKIQRKGPIIERVVDNNGRQFIFSYHKGINKVKQIVGPNGLKATYEFKGEDLISAVNAWKNKFGYDYDDLHNLTKVTFPDKTTIALTYNRNKDWVTSFKNRKDCKEEYKYEEDPKDPINHYWATVTKTCGKKVTNNSRFEFFHRKSVVGAGRYLYRARSEVNGDVTDIIYHDVFGKPIIVNRNGIKVTYSYYDSGLVKEKTEPDRRLAFEYKNQCKKVSKVTTVYYALREVASKDGSKKRVKKPVKQTTTNFAYEKKKCNLMAARNSDGQRVDLKYDERGRIARIKDQAQKIVLIKYEERFGKPSIVTRPGLGTIKVTYKADGKINKVTSKEGPSVAVQVASIFNNLLDIIAPATSEVSI